MPKALIPRKLVLNVDTSSPDVPIKKSKLTAAAPRKKKTVLSIADYSPTQVGDVILTCGNGDVGQLAHGEDASADRCSKPKRVKKLVPPANGFLQIAAGSFHTVVLTSDHKVYTSGCSDDCALGRDCLEDDGTTPRIDDQDFLLRPIALPAEAVETHGRPVQISAGDSHSALLTEKGSVFVWGTFRDKQGCLGLNLQLNNCRKSSDGGGLLDKSAVPVLISSYKERCSVKIASGFNHLTLLGSDGTVYTMGAGDAGQLGRLAPQFRDGSSSLRTVARMLTPLPVAPEHTRSRVYFKDIWCAGYCCYAKSTDDVIYVWGLNNYYQLGFVPHDTEQNSIFYPIKSEQFRNDNKWTQFAGDHHIIAVDDKKNVHVIGRGDDSRLGTGSNDARQTLAQLKSLNGTVAGVAAGNSYSFVWQNNGHVLSWGYDLEGETGQGLEDNAAIESPQLVSANSLKNVKVIQISAGGQHAVMLGKQMAETGNSDH